MPERVLFTRSALGEGWGQQIYERVAALGLPIEELKGDRLPPMNTSSARTTYNRAKRTLAVVNAPDGARKLQPIPPSADWQFHLAQGCPAHCQYCYLAGSLSGLPLIRAYANLPKILENLQQYERADRVATFEASCYTDPLSIEHLTGSLAECIRYFGTRERANLRWVTKFDDVESLVGLPHNGNTRCRFSVNAEPISRRWEGGTASVAARLAAASRLASPEGSAYPIGLVVAPIITIPDWQDHYRALLDTAADTLPWGCDLTFELITHRWTDSSKAVLTDWYPNTTLPMDQTERRIKRNKFGGTKYVYPADMMRELRGFFEREIARRFPYATVLYWT
jgi:spore photoproduct lyase